MKRAHDANVLVFSWGADKYVPINFFFPILVNTKTSFTLSPQNSNETGPVEKQQKAGVDAIISDNILRVRPQGRAGLDRIDPGARLATETSA